MNNEPLVIERILDAPVQIVWEAITQRDQMKEWYFTLEEFKAEVGFEFTFTGGDGNKSWLHACRVTEVVPGKKLSYTWKYPGYAGESHVIFELFEIGNKTRLRLTHEGLDSFPKEVPELAKENFMQGWTQIIGTNLHEFVQRVFLTTKF